MHNLPDHRGARRLLAFTLMLALAAAGAAAWEPGEADPKAAALAQKTLDAMGGQEAWDATRFLRFNFFGFRLHHWDRATGRHRLEGKSRDGDAYVVLHNVHSRQGRVWINGEEQEGEARATWLERAYGAWVNDTYWLVMPYKLRDPGVTLTYDGEETIDGKVYDKLHLSFTEVGLTPEDRYWAYISRESGLMERWAYHLQDWEDDREPTHWQWLDWARYGGVMLSTRRVNPTTPDTPRGLSELAVLDQLSDSAFEDPAPVAGD